jgi:N,N'-diacetyllegionaminate synthase
MSYFDKLVDEASGGIFVIAEACDNHMGSLEMARTLARIAKIAGADAVKFQHHIAYEEMLREATMSDNFDEHLYDFLEKNSLSLDDHIRLKNFCDELGILYLCTPFSFKAAEEIQDLVPFFKIGSGEFIDHWFIDNLKSLGKPVIFSTGMCTHQELLDNVSWLKGKGGLDFALLNCLSEYPPKLSDLNLDYICDLRNLFPDIVIGHSDHTTTTVTSILAASKGARIIEKHLTISEHVNGPDRSVSLGGDDFKSMIQELRMIREVCGDKKIINDLERPVRDWAYRSLVTTNDLVKGHMISKDDICSKRPGTGIPSKNYFKVIGKKVTRDIKRNEMLRDNDLE